MARSSVVLFLSKTIPSNPMTPMPYHFVIHFFGLNQSRMLQNILPPYVGHSSVVASASSYSLLVIVTLHVALISADYFSLFFATIKAHMPVSVVEPKVICTNHSQVIPTRVLFQNSKYLSFGPGRQGMVSAPFQSDSSDHFLLLPAVDT